MKYKLYKSSLQDTKNVNKTILLNRGIEDYNKYLNLTDDVLIPYSNLENINEAVKCFLNHYNQGNKMAVLVDSDPDGYCSAAMIYKYIKECNKEYPIKYVMQTISKSHGLKDIDLSVFDDVGLIIIPDASTNDCIECKKLKDKGIDIIILDHHEQEIDNPNAIIVNNQISENYLNKNLCGAGIVYKFLQALDVELWNEYADNYLDLVALANIADMMDIRSFETRRLIDKGLNNIRNMFFNTFIKAQSYVMQDNITIRNIQWNIVPVLNAMIRIGSLEDKELVFRAFIEDYDEFEYMKRATKNKPSELLIETIYDKSVRLCKNIKSKQDRVKTKCIEELSGIIENNFTEIDKVIVIDGTDIVDGGLTGVVAMNIANKYTKPTILLRNNGKQYSGSIRNFRNSPIESFKDAINSCSVFTACLGHGNAAGVNLPIDKIEDARKELNEVLKEVEYDDTFYVDYILNINDVDLKLVRELAILQDITGQGIEPPSIAINEIALGRNDFEICGKNSDTVSFEINGIKYIMFKCNENHPILKWIQNSWDNERIKFEIVGTPSINDFNGFRNIQVVIDGVNIVETFTFDGEFSESGSSSENDDFDW